jgi:hypothetical protein
MEEADGEVFRDIFLRDDGKEVRPPKEIEELHNDIVAAVGRYLDSLGHEHKNFTENVEQWGGCPQCHENHGFYFFGKQQWFVCQRHRLSWKGDYGLNSSWEHMTAEYLWTQKMLLEYGFEQIKEPWFPPHRENRHTVACSWLGCGASESVVIPRGQLSPSSRDYPPPWAWVTFRTKEAGGSGAVCPAHAHELDRRLQLDHDSEDEIVF